MRDNPWKLDDEDRAEGARMLADYVEGLDGPVEGQHPVEVARDQMLVACHVTNSVEVGIIIRAIFLAMKYGGVEARDRLVANCSSIALDYEPLDPERN